MIRKISEGDTPSILKQENNLIQHLENEVDQFFIPAVYISDDHPFLLASLDGITVGEDIIAEVKVVSMEKFLAAKHSNICQSHILQMQCQMPITALLVQLDQYHLIVLL